MKTVLLAVCLCLVDAEAQAISRYDPTRMSCGQVRSTIDRDGAAILRYRSPRNPSLTLYDRYVSDERFCERGEYAVPAFVPSADRKSCPVRNCKVIDPDDHFGRIIIP